MFSIGPWWTRLSRAEQSTFINYLKVLCARKLITDANKAAFVENVCLRVLDPEEGNGEINQSAIADLTAVYGYSAGMVLIVTKHLFDQFMTPISAKEAARLMNIDMRNIDDIRALCRKGTLTAHKNPRGHWLITPASVINHIMPNRWL